MTTTIRLRPGIDVEQSPVLNEAGWSACQNIRWRDGLPEKVGGYAAINLGAPVIGTGRGMHAWADLAGNDYVAVGSEQRLGLFNAGVMNDITPIRQIDNVAVAFTTTAGQRSVKVTDAGNNASVSDWVDITVPVSVGGVIIQGFYQIASIIDANDYTIMLAQPAVSNVTAGGVVPSFTTTLGSANVEVTLNNHGLAAGANFIVNVATTVGGVTLTPGFYPVLSSPAPTTNTFYIAGGTTATSGATVAENGGQAQLQYLISTGEASATTGGGFGSGVFGGGVFGSSSGTSDIALRQWFLDNWGQDLIGNYAGSPIYVWVPPIGINNPAIPIDTTTFPGALEPPTAVNSSFLAMPQQIYVALGCAPYGNSTIDPMLVRWCDQSDFTDWQAEVTNQAGSYRLPNGSRIVGGIQGPSFGMIWTDVGMWLMQYLAYPLVFGFNAIAGGTTLIGARAAAVWQTSVYWCGNDNFYMFDGSSVQVIPCPVWDVFFKNVDLVQADKIFCAVNSWFGEISWYAQSNQSGGDVDMRVTYNVRENLWTYDGPGMSAPRTCWIDTNVFGAPMGVDLSGLIQQHEVSPDANGQSIMASVTSGYMALDESGSLTFIKKIFPDFVFTGGVAPNNRVFIALLIKDYPTDSPTVVGPYPWTPTGPPYITFQRRGRLIAFQVSSTDLGVFWRLGAVRHDSARAGRL